MIIIAIYKGRMIIGEMTEDRWIRIEEPANYLGVNKDTIRNQIKKGNGILVYKISKWRKLKNLNYIVGLKVGKVLLNTERKDIR